MKTRLLVALGVLLALGAPAATADTLTSTASWKAWTGASQHNATPFAGNPFWDNASKDGDATIAGGNNCNIGFWVSGTGNCSVTNFYAGSPGTGASYLGDGTSDVIFTGTNTPNQVTATVGVSALSATTEFGWFDTATGTRHSIIGGGSMGSSTSFSVPSGDYGFYVSVVDPRAGAAVPSATFYSNAPDALGRTHFALFNLGNGSYVLGIEDKQGDPTGKWASLSDYDYNDLVIRLTTTPVPEPTSMALLATGLFGLAAVVRRRRKS